MEKLYKEKLSDNIKDKNWSWSVLNRVSKPCWVIICGYLNKCNLAFFPSLFPNINTKNLLKATSKWGIRSLKNMLQYQKKDEKKNKIEIEN